MFILLPLACSLYALSAILLISLLLHLSPIPFRLLASAYSSLSIKFTALLRGVHFMFHYFNIFLYSSHSTAYSSTCIQLSSFHQLSRIILIPNFIVLFLHCLFLRTSVFCKSRLFYYCYISLRFPYKIFFFCTVSRNLLIDEVLSFFINLAKFA